LVLIAAAFQMTKGCSVSLTLSSQSNPVVYFGL